MRSYSLLLCLSLCVWVTTATEGEENISDTVGDNICKADEEAAKLCLACSSLPFQAEISYDMCCQDKESFIFCDACTHDQEACKIVVDEAEDVKTMYDDYSSDVDGDDYNDYNSEELNDMIQDDNTDIGVQKRYGKLFVTSPKRFGRLFFGKRDGREIDLNKRFGRLFTGRRNRNSKRYGTLYTGSKYWFGKRSDDSMMDKRFGRIYMGSGGRGRFRMFGKRSFGDDFSDELLDTDKRFGRLFTGKRGIEWDDFGEDDANPLEKRFGSLFVSSKFGKRSGLDEGDEDVEKRFGRLYMNRMKSWRRPTNGYILGKRFGKLFTGSRRYYFG